MKRCIPGECEHCAAWESLPDKVRCEKRGTLESGGGWWSTTRGAKCAYDEDGPPTLFDAEALDNR